MGNRTDDIDRFWSKLDLNGPVPDYAPYLGPCSMWTGKPNRNGYGEINAHDLDGNRKTWEVHRYAWVVVAGLPVTPGWTLDHLCRVTMCANVRHLEEVPRGENVMRGTGVGPQNAAKTHCAQGHLYDEANVYRRRKGGRICKRCTAAWGAAARTRPPTPEELTTLTCPECGTAFVVRIAALRKSDKTRVGPKCCSVRCTTTQQHKRARGEL